MTFNLRTLPLALCLVAGAAAAQSVLVPAPQNVVSLSAQASLDVPQDMLTISLGITRDGTEAAAVQSQLRQALDAALTEARKAVRPGQVDVRTGGFSLFPRYASKAGSAPTIAGWQGQARGRGHTEHERWPLDGTLTPRALPIGVVNALCAFQGAAGPGSGIVEYALSRSPSYHYTPTLS